MTAALAALGMSMAYVLEAAAGTGNTSVRDQIIGRLTAASATLPVTRSLLRSAQAWSDEVWRAASGDSLAAFAAATLEQRLASPPRAADDWSIPLPPGCDCELCRTLGTFLTDAAREHLEWPLATPGRRHIHSRIDLAELPVTHRTRRSGRPYTLVLTKTRELFARDEAARQHARADLTELEDAAAERAQHGSPHDRGRPGRTR